MRATKASCVGRLIVRQRKVILSQSEISYIIVFWPPKFSPMWDYSTIFITNY